MARTTPKITDNVLRHFYRGRYEPILHIVHEWNQWQGWLQQADLFAYDSSAGTFTATRENRANGKFWYATRRLRGKQRTIYLGKAEDLTSERLEKAARDLANLTSYEFEGQRWRKLVDVLKAAGLQLHEDRLGQWTWSWPAAGYTAPPPALQFQQNEHAAPENAIIDAVKHLLVYRLNLSAIDGEEQP